MEENNNQNNNDNLTNSKIEIVDASLLNPFESNIKNNESNSNGSSNIDLQNDLIKNGNALNIESNHVEVDSIEKSVNQDSSNIINNKENVSNQSPLQKSNSLQAENNNSVASESIAAGQIVNNHNFVTQAGNMSNDIKNESLNNSVNNSVVTPSSNEQSTNNVSYSVNSSIEIDDELLDAYIGPNATKIKAQGISWPTFWLGLYYVLYRKMWLLAFALFVVSFIATLFLPSLSSIISLGLGILIFVSFNKMYINHAKEDIKKIII